VAIKVLPEAVLSEPDRIARFEREAKVLAALNHANIAALFGMEESNGRRHRGRVMASVMPVPWLFRRRD